jgi:hypothetical protein
MFRGTGLSMSDAVGALMAEAIRGVAEPSRGG